VQRSLVEVIAHGRQVPSTLIVLARRDFAELMAFAEYIGAVASARAYEFARKQGAGRSFSPA